MKLLIDTHIFLWIIFQPEKIPQRLRNKLIEKEAIIYISIITFWEISLKFSLGKIDLKGILPDELPKIAKNDGFEILEMDIDTVSSFYKLPKLNKDPFDRMLAWQAIKSGCCLLTQDSSFAGYEKEGLKII